MMRLLLALSFLFTLVGFCHAQEENALPTVERPSRWDTAPRFPGGAMAWRQYVEDSVRTPAGGWPAGRSGHVLAEVGFDSLGRVTAVRIVNGVPGAAVMARETERLLWAMPAWEPATKDGRPVPAEVPLSIPFPPRWRRIR